ncbi:hypothetical protein HELRODRAFT_173820 [Helobdella robusta]|uniref:Spen paralogue and orthologue SPOC C-terminal domain-containing protein n=1 Tax=Helobdella robusta TaxID=6412 RepID=T1F7A0_HELRO|nr:hypothetical protein HELRODRAFT_173820 [Helobdella robusta]ESO02985.1 hypothetical protein HELRODRAFT_173820 [Helobdella robusta]
MVLELFDHIQQAPLMLFPPQIMLLPKNLSILGRISYEAIEEYIAKIKSIYFNSKEIAVICFNYIGKDKKEKSDFQALFEYLNNKKRCAVIGSIGTLIKDMYLWPLHSTSPIPSLLVPFDGPGLDVNRGDVLLGIIVQQVSNAVSNAVSFHTDSVITDPTEDVEAIVKKYKKQQDCQDEHDIKQLSLIDTKQDLQTYFNFSKIIFCAGTEEAIDDITNGVDETIHLETTSISESLNARFDAKCHNSQADSTEAAMYNLSVSLENIPLPPDTKVGTTSTGSSINIRCDKIIEHIQVDKNSISHPKEITIDVSSNTKFDKKKVETNPQILNKTHARTSTEELLTSLNSLIENYIAAQTVGTTDSNDTATNITGSKNDRIINSNTDGRGSVDGDQIEGAETSVHLNENSCKINTYNPNLPNNLWNCNITKDQQILMKQALRFVKMTNVNDNPDGCHTKCDNSSYASPIQRNDIFGQHFFHDNGCEMVSKPSFKPITIEYNHHRQPDHSSSLDNDHHYMFASQVPLNYKPQNYHSVSSQSRSQSDLCHQQPNYGSNKTYLDSDPPSSSNTYLHFEKYGKNQQKKNDYRKNHHGHNHQPLGHQQNFPSNQKINTNSNRRYNFTDKKPFRYQKY